MMKPDCKSSICCVCGSSVQSSKQQQFQECDFLRWLLQSGFIGSAVSSIACWEHTVGETWGTAGQSHTTGGFCRTVIQVFITVCMWQMVQQTVKWLTEEKSSLLLRLKQLEDDKQQLHIHTQQAQLELSHTLDMLRRYIHQTGSCSHSFSVSLLCKIWVMDDLKD